jgi:hypothetical protein
MAQILSKINKANEYFKEHAEDLKRGDHGKFAPVPIEVDTTAHATVSEVKMTTDYGQFKILDENRVVSAPHVLRLAKSLAQNPEFLKFRPVLVNEKMEVIDGQHRLRACEKLGIPVYYVVGDSLDISAAQRLNAEQVPWKPIDYARSFAALGKYPYQLYLSLMEDYPLPHETLESFMRGSATGGKGSKAFRRGGFHLSEGVTEMKIRQDLELLMDTKEYAPGFYRKRGFSLAFLRMIQSPQYDHRMFLSKLQRLGTRYLTNASNLSDNLRALEEVYNHSTSFDKTIRLF